jgi:hypothetical protein
MNPTVDWFLKIFCVLSWAIITVIIFLGLISHASPLIFSLFAKIVKYLFFGFWGFTFLSLLLLIPWEEKQYKKNLREKKLKKKQDKDKNEGETGEESRGARLPGILTLFMVVPTGLVVIESYLLIKTLYYMWIIILVIGAYAIYTGISGKETIKNKVIGIQLGFITALGISISVLYLYWVSGIFHQPFLDSARFIDNTIFSAVAGEVGDNYREITVKDIDGSNIREAAPGTFPGTLAGYTRQLKNGKLKGKSLPYEFQGNQTQHAIFIDRALEFLADENVEKTGKQKIMGALLDYLVLVTKEGYIDEINRQDKKHQINIIFLGKLHDLIILQNLETGTWKCFLCRIKEYTKINISRFGIPLGKKECEPCLKN